MGKQIRIYLADSSPTGVRHGEITNWTGQALACPRGRFGELREWSEIRRPGVYFLFGLDESTGDQAVYVGESEVVLDRLTTHMSGKDFWGELIAFTSKDDNLTKAHVKYLESRLISIAISAGRYMVTNGASPQLPSLPRADRDAMEEFLESVRILLGVLGHRPLDPLITLAKHPTETTLDANAVAAVVPIPGSETQTTNITLHLQSGGLSATGVKTDEGLVVLAGAQAAVVVKDSLSMGYRVLRERLIESGAFLQDGKVLKLQSDQLFSSPSQAAAVLVGYSINGKDAWRLADGTTLGQYEQRSTEQLLRELANL